MGKGTTTANLVASLARLGIPVVAVDAGPGEKLMMAVVGSIVQQAWADARAEVVIDEFDAQPEVVDQLRIKVVLLFHLYMVGVPVASFASRDKERIIAAIAKYTSPLKEPEIETEE
ncbi:hypothetical protein ZWY2020_059069 [Hordeum vulgare]|nr:hypothetical protein ZWY2020_059069 [Hordeum vulgare]